jgi:hypothetical protein
MMSERNVFAYEPRRVTAEPVISLQGHRIKPYHLAHPDVATAVPGKDCDIPLLLSGLLKPIVDPRLHGIGFCMVHRARDGVYFLLGRWYDGNNLLSESYRVVLEAGSPAPNLTRLELFACIWEMAVYQFERDAWVATVMAGGRGLAAADRYLECRFEGWV